MIRKLRLCTYLAMLVQNVPKEPVGIWEALRAGTLPHADHSVLLGVENSALGLGSSKKEIVKCHLKMCGNK